MGGWGESACDGREASLLPGALVALLVACVCVRLDGEEAGAAAADARWVGCARARARADADDGADAVGTAAKAAAGDGRSGMSGAKGGWGARICPLTDVARM